MVRIVTAVKKWKIIATGAAAGAINGLLGAGGGMIMVPLLLFWCGLEEKKALATSVAAIVPLCAVSAAVCLARGGTLPQGSIWYLLGGLAGGAAGGLLMKKFSSDALIRIFGAIMLIAGIRTVFF